MTDFICIAHRGASGSWPENTLLAFREALKAGAGWLELDVHLSADSELVVIHDSTVQRTTDGYGKVEELTLAELRRFDAGMGEKIPLLEEVLTLVAGKAALNIELKGAGTGEAVAELLRRRVAKNRPMEFLASSLNEKELIRLASILPQIPLALVAEAADRQTWQLAEKLDVWSLHLEKSSIDQHLVAEAKARKRKLLAYTVNDRQEVQRLREWGVDGVFTDFPEQDCFR